MTMTALTIRLPNSVHESIKALARKDGISVNQFIASAAAEKMASFQTLDYLRLKPRWASATTLSSY
jgi:predicted DNA-binding ribbon-helix-helix protein